VKPLALLAALLTSCAVVDDAVESNCRWMRDEVVELEWADGQTCQRVCVAHPFHVSTLDFDIEASGCEPWPCAKFYPGEGVQVWRDPVAGPAANFGDEDWWTEECQ
jgi:hypothetical protein